MQRVLLVGTTKKVLRKLQNIFSSVRVSCETFSSLEAASERISNEPPSLVITENPDQVELLRPLKTVLNTRAPTTPFLVLLPNPTAERALTLMKAGAYDCIGIPFDRMDVLASAKRAALNFGRMLFVARVEQSHRRILSFIAGTLILLAVIFGFAKLVDGPPPKTINLGSAHLAGVQWEGRNLWVADWLDATVTKYRSAKAVFRKSRILETKEIYQMQDGQPIFICATPQTLFTIGGDLKIRSHHLALGLPTLQTTSSPGTNPTGLAWDGEYLWSVDGRSNLLYRHSSDLKVLDTVKSIIKNPAGLSFYKGALWVIGGDPLMVAKMTPFKASYLWEGPFRLSNLVPEGVVPSGLGVGFDHLWVVSGGDPRFFSKRISEVMKDKVGWDKNAE